MLQRKYLTLLFILMLAIIGGSCFSATVSFVQKSKDINKANYRIDQKYPYLTAKTPLAKAVNSDIKRILDSSTNTILSSLENKTKSTKYYSHSTYKVTNSDNQLFSAVIYLSEYTGETPKIYSRVVNFASNGKQVSRVTLTDLIKSDPDSINNLKNMLIMGVNEQRRSKNLNPINDIQDKYLESFVITPFDVNWIFDYNTVDENYNRDYNITLNWRELSDILNTNTIAYDFVATNKTKIRIDGDAFLLDNAIAPKGAKLQIRLVWILTDKSKAPKVMQTYERPFVGNSVPYNLVLDWKNLNEKNEYQVQFNVIYKNTIIYDSAATMVLSIQGWPRDTLVALKNVNY